MRRHTSRTRASTGVSTSRFQVGDRVRTICWEEEFTGTVVNIPGEHEFWELTVQLDQVTHRTYGFSRDELELYVEPEDLPDED